MTEPGSTDSTLIWSSDVRPIRNIPFEKENCGVQINISETSTPRDLFDKLFTSEIMDMLVVSTNAYGNELYSKPAPAERKSPKTIPNVAANILLPYAHIITKAEKESNKLSRITPLLQKLLKTFNDAFVTHKELSLDESLLLWRGRLSFRQFIKDKAAKYGIKFYELTTSDGYVLNVMINQGKTSEPDDKTSKTAKIVLQLMQPYLDKGHHLYMDNFYNSVTLSTHLLSKQTHTTGTLRSDRKDNPKSVVHAKLKKGEINWQRCGDVYVNKWKDKRDVLTISTAHHPKHVETKNRHGQSKLKPQDVADYNKYMSGIDRLDQMVSYYNSTRRPRGAKISQEHIETSTSCEALSQGTSLIELSIEIATHRLAKIPVPDHHKRKSYFQRCRPCNNKNVRKDTSYRCMDCEGNPPMC
ncbi:hypothetical protein HA402_009916 [Bradysia odoriphaga]|nr:hypothetical protein HA402_009916 [Bradysia odoriphaga]